MMKANYRKAFTMIELVFVIVVIGILASLAIPKLQATRDDAKVSTELSTVAARIESILNIYNAKGTFNLNDTANLEVECFTFVDSEETNGTIYVDVRRKDGQLPNYCDSAEAEGIKNNLVGQHILTIAGRLVVR